MSDLLHGLRNAPNKVKAIRLFIKSVWGLIKDPNFILTLTSSDYIQFYSSEGDFGIVVGRVRVSGEKPAQQEYPADRLVQELKKLIPEGLLEKHESGLTLTLFLSEKDKELVRKL